jgi:tryptophanyl-tRNA synthetase
MTKNEIEQIAEIMMTADGGCGHCVSELLEQLEETFPEFKETIEEVWNKEYDCDFRED